MAVSVLHVGAVESGQELRQALDRRVCREGCSTTLILGSFSFDIVFELGFGCLGEEDE